MASCSWVFQVLLSVVLWDPKPKPRSSFLAATIILESVAVDFGCQGLRLRVTGHRHRHTPFVCWFNIWRTQLDWALISRFACFLSKVHPQEQCFAECYWAGGHVLCGRTCLFLLLWLFHSMVLIHFLCVGALMEVCCRNLYNLEKTYPLETNCRGAPMFSEKTIMKSMFGSSLFSLNLCFSMVVLFSRSEQNQPNDHIKNIPKYSNKKYHAVTTCLSLPYSQDHFQVKLMRRLRTQASELDPIGARCFLGLAGPEAQWHAELGLRVEVWKC